MKSHPQSVITIFLTIIVGLLIGNVGFSQEKYYTNNGFIIFDATAEDPLSKEIVGKSYQAVAIYRPESLVFKTYVPVKSFKFKIPLMEEHFNTFYAESDLYPKAEFEGKITKIDDKKIIIEGEFTLHGVTKRIIAEGNLHNKENGYKLSASFMIQLSNYKIDIPTFLRNKIAPEVLINLEYYLIKSKQQTQAK